MAKRSNAPRGGLTPGKSIAIGILAVVLLVVIVTQFGGQKSEELQPRGKQTAAEKSAATSSPDQTAAPTEVRRSDRPWPSFDVAAVVASNPFMVPEVLFPGRETAETQNS
ncbi:MAG: hypothetical protein O3C40_30410 [Planctomycetota bacterium]|nr:hypothetical protein [Planctomycetota bacterium]